MEHVARLAYANPDVLLFFRGQDKDYQSRAGGTTLYPAIYRGDSLAARELRHRFDVLDQAARLLVEKFKAARIAGHRELRQKRYIQWGILQHYEVVTTCSGCRTSRTESQSIPNTESALYPKDDRILKLCAGLRTDLREELQAGDLGEFVREWADIEEYLVDAARRATARNISVREAIGALERRGTLNSDQALQLDTLRRLRNALVHEPTTVRPGTLEEWLPTMRHLRRQLRRETPA